MTQRRSNPPAANNIRRKLEAEFKRPIPERMWQYLLALGVIEDYLACPDSDTWQNVKWHCREQFALMLSGRESRRGQEGGPGARVRLSALPALDLIVAAEASRLPEVRRFRKRFLGGKLIPQEKIVEWLTQQGLSQGEPTRFATVTTTYALPDDFQLPDGDTESQVRALVHLPTVAATLEGPRHETITYVDAQRGEGTIPVRYKSPLWHLWRVIDRLREECPIWTEKNAGVTESEIIAFILSGAPPSLATVSVVADPDGRYPFMIRMFCPVNTERRLINAALSDVFRAMSEPRTTKAAAQGKRPRNRPMTEKHLRLAVYLAEHSETSWRQLMASWNADYPQWAYVSWRNFSRDAKVAWCRVTGREWTPRRARKERTQNAEEES